MILDGTSKTYLVGEKFMDPDRYDYLGTTSTFDWGDNQSMYCGFDWDNHRLAFGPNSQDDDPEFYQPSQDTAGPVLFPNYKFGSAHPGGFNMAMCDGSVHTIAYDIDSTSHSYLANRFDGESVISGF
jgi:prepilin-type processing-associated H-X9-DG protein